MTFTAFLAKLQALQNSIAITTPVVLQVKRSYWGKPSEAISDLPCVINALAEPDRVLGFGSRDQRVRINIQLLAAKAMPENPQSGLIATAFWYAAKTKFDRDTKIGDTVAWSTLRGADPTVPVILECSGMTFIGFNAILDIRDFEAFTF